MSRLPASLLMLAILLATAACANTTAPEPTDAPITEELTLPIAETASNTPSPPTATATALPTNTPRPTLTRTPRPTLTPTPEGMIGILRDRGVSVVAFSPDGSLLAAGHRGQGVSIWDTGTWKKIATLNINAETREAHQLQDDAGCCGGEMTDIEFSPDGKLLAVARPYIGIGGDTPSMARIDLWDVTTEEFITALPGDWKLFDIEFSPNGRMLAGGVDSGQSPVPAGKVILWDTATWAVLKVLEDAQPKVMFTPDSARLITQSGVAAIYWDPGQSAAAPMKIWNAASGGLIRTVDAGGFVTQSSLSPDGRVLAVGVLIPDSSGLFGSAKLTFFDAVSFEELSSFDLTLDIGFLASMVFSPDGTLLVTVSQPGRVIFRDATTGESIRDYTLPIQLPQGPVFSPDGRLVAIPTLDEIVLFQVEP